MPRLIVLLYLSALHCLACAARERLPVKLFDDAAVGNRVLEVAKAEAAWLLTSVCIEVNWIFCTDGTACSGDANAPELHVVQSPLTVEAQDVMGNAYFKAGSWGLARVYLSRVRRMVNLDAGIIGVPGLLGHVMAHEIGHLLLRSAVHSSEGLMRAGFRRSDLKKASQRRLGFTRQQSSLIQQRLLAQSR